VFTRIAPDLHGSGLIDAIPDDVIAEGAVPRRDGIDGRANRLRDADGRERIGRVGWKADAVTLRQFVADAFRNELGITSPQGPADLAPAGGYRLAQITGLANPVPRLAPVR
jgi:CxxC motif-containing protein (DUF1111 family)